LKCRGVEESKSKVEVGKGSQIDIFGLSFVACPRRCPGHASMLALVSS
jgi:hypothetical protein